LGIKEEIIVDKLDKLLEGIVEKCLSIFDKLLNKLDKKCDDEEFIDKIGRYINSKIEEKK